MKKVVFAVSLLALQFAMSCTKTHESCQPQKTPCPASPKAVGMAVLSQGEQVGSYIFDVSIYYTNPNQDNLESLQFWIGDKEYAEKTHLPYADTAALGVATFTIALAVDTFTIKSIGYHVPQRCDCDSTVSYTYYEKYIAQ